MAQMILERLQQKFGEAVLKIYSQHGDETAEVDPNHLLEVASFLRDDPALQMNLPVDCTAVDFYKKRSMRFDVIWHLYSLVYRHRMRLKVQVGEDHLRCPSLTPLWPGMNWHEREAWDMYGIFFSNHPHLKRILMYDAFEGHPLRKDYPIDKRQPLIAMRKVEAIPTERQPPADMLNPP